MTDFARLVLDADTRGLKNAERDLQGVARAASKSAMEIGKSMRNVGLGLSAGVTAPLAFFAKGAAQAAIDAEEMGSAFNVVFGDMADDVRAWAEETGNALGRSTQEIQRGALAFQELFGKALDPMQAAEMSKQFAVLTQDLASFKNLSNEVAQQKLFSGLVGESEPLRAVGVFINEAAVSAKALELGLTGVNGKLTDQEKIIARAAIINEQLSAAQGDVLRTSDSTANQLKTTQAAFEELQVVVGTKLLPVLTPLIEKLGAALTWFTELPEPVQDVVLTATALAAALGPVLAAIGSIITIAPAVATAFGIIKAAALLLMANPVILAFAAVIAGIYLAWQNWDKIEPILINLYTAVKTWVLDKLAAVFDIVRNKIRQVEETFAWLYDRVVGNSWIPDMVDGIAGQMNRLDEVMVQPTTAAVQGVDGAFAKLADKAETQTVRISETFAQMSQRIVGSLQGLANSIQSGNFLGILGGVLDIFTQLGSIGVFGSGIQSNLNRPIAGARANGGSVASGSTYLVGERGPELFTPHGHGRIVSNDNMGGSTHITVGIDPASGNVLAFVDGRIAATGPVIANAGAMQAQAMGARSARRRVR